MEITSRNIGLELKKWFEKSIIMHDDIDFNVNDYYKKALDVFLADYKRYYPEDLKLVYEKLVARRELIGILLYRIAREFYLGKKEDIANKFSMLSTTLGLFEIYYSAEIGAGLKINHGIGTVIGARTKIGVNALIHHGVTFGDKDAGRPVIGDNVIVYAGAKVLGNVKIGNNAIIGANAVCFINVPENMIAIGVPAKLKSK